MATLSRIGALSARRSAFGRLSGASTKLSTPVSARSLSTVYSSPIPRIRDVNQSRVLAYTLAHRSFSSTPSNFNSTPTTPVPPPTEAPTTQLESTTAAIPPETTDVLASTDPSLLDQVIQHTGDHIGDLAALGLGGWTPSGMVQQLLEQFHAGLGLPWWGSIVLLTAVIRISLFRMQAKAAANNSRIATVSDEVQKMVGEMKDAQARRDTAAMARVQQKMMGIYAKAGGHPLKGLIPVAVQMPVAISMFFGIRKLCSFPLESMKTGGAFWFTDLTASDPTYILPIMSTGAMLLMMQLSAADTPQTAASGHMRNAFKVMSIVFLPFMAVLPNGVFMYFITNGLLLGVQTALLRLPAIRNWAGIVPPPPPKQITAQAVLAAGGKPENENPSIKDSFHALIDAYKKRVSEAIAEKEASDAAKKRQHLSESRLLPKAAPTIQAKKRPA